MMTNDNDHDENNNGNELLQYCMYNYAIFDFDNLFNEYEDYDDKW